MAAYTIPQVYMEIAKKEIDELVDLDVLTLGVDTAWKSPSFFCKKKDGGIRFVSYFRKFNEALERDTFPLPVIDDVIWKLQCFSFATCFNLNQEYYHFAIDEK